MGDIMRKVYYVTGNLGKVESARKYLNNIDVEMINYDFIEPDVNDIRFTAEWKGRKAYELVNEPCIALDSGFYIPKYPDENNFPGAFVKRKLIDGIGIDGLLDKMSQIADRYCYFLECLAYYDGEKVEFFYGKSDGSLAYNKSGVNNEKKWSPLWEVFIPIGCDKTLSEMSDEERFLRPNSTHAFLEFNNWYCQKSKIHNRKKK